MELTLMEAGVLLDALKLWETKINDTFVTPESRIIERARVHNIQNKINNLVNTGRTSF